MHKEAVAKINSEHEARLKEIEASKPTDKMIRMQNLLITIR